MCAQASGTLVSLLEVLSQLIVCLPGSGIAQPLGRAELLG